MKYDGLNVRQALIKEIVDKFEAKNPELIKEVSKSTADVRKSRANVFAADSTSDYDQGIQLRWGLRLPGKLYRIFDALIQDPSIFHEEEEYKWFIKEYPHYRVPEKL